MIDRNTNNNQEPEIQKNDLETPGGLAFKKPKRSHKKRNIIIIIVVASILLIAGVILALYSLVWNKPKETLKESFKSEPDNSTKYYSPLTGNEVASAELTNAPIYCMQTPNGLDGARPQVGVNEAGVVFEAIAEAGITRFAALYQNPKSSAIGPIRSLRMYYLEWDTPFDCTIVHAGGADDALAALRSGGYRDLTEDYTYMFRSNSGNRLWNNLFTTATDLAKFNSNNGYSSSNAKGFSRLSPKESEVSRIDSQVVNPLDIDTATNKDTSELKAEVPRVSIIFGGDASYNTYYEYDVASNSYKRFYGTGDAHEVYDCPEGLDQPSPENNCNGLVQLSPNVVIAMIVQEKRASDNYHEDITTIGSGDAYIFQNGTVIKGTWEKPSREDQISFKNEKGEAVSLAVGQTWIAAVPNYGSVEY